MTTIERVARGILADIGNGAALNLDDPYRRVITVQLSSADLMGMARAALETIREPTEAMLAAANALPITARIDSIISLAAMRTGGASPIDPPPNSPIQQWFRAMINAALEEVAARE